jgi:hypothetical protein|tara:strand:- start:7842 stop:8066 length:225 start_codon:yes stop_codon:yes gene_type:complete
MLTAVVSIMAAFVVIGGFMLGVLIGWVWKSYADAASYEPELHPEMFDQYGRVIPDELIAVRFETEDDDELEDEE